jgi:hypothetical protein
MPYKDLTRRREHAKICNHRHYILHKQEIIARSYAWKQSHPGKNREFSRISYHRKHPDATYSRKYAPIPSPVPLQPILIVKETIQPPQAPPKHGRLPGEDDKTYNARRSLAYYHKHKAQVSAKYQAAKALRIANTPVVSVDPGFVSRRMLKLIEELGEVDARWFEEVRIKICNTVGAVEYDHDRFWNLLKANIVKRIGMSCFSAPTPGKYKMFAD